jgi:pyrimidine-nucleoside phosphorylase
MRDSGETINLSDLANVPALDKHSTGGVGDKTSLVVIPILAAAGVPILKMSGRGLGFSGGTVDKLESIPGFRADLSNDEAKRMVQQVGAVMIGQNSRLAPADKILYALRDVTATVESIPLIAASIMCKKLAAGGRRILLDVKCGKGAFMKTRERAELLAQELVAIGTGAGIPTVAVLTLMDEPLGCTIGNALEVREAIELMGSNSIILDKLGHRSDACIPFLHLSIKLAAHGLVMARKATSIKQGCEIVGRLLANGEALNKLVEIVAAQGGPQGVNGILDSLPVAEQSHAVPSRNGGYVAAVDAEAIGKLATEMGAGRLMKGDQIDHSVGIVLHCKTGSPVMPGMPLATLHLREQDILRAEELAEMLREAYIFKNSKPKVADDLVLGVFK